MKKIIIAAIMLFSLNVGIQAQEVVREGKTFKAVSKSKANKGSKHKADTLITSFIFENSKGNKYPIIVNKGSGSCYVWKKSGKTGKLYKMYMKSEVSQAICKELKIQYKPRNKK